MFSYIVVCIIFVGVFVPFTFTGQDYIIYNLNHIYLLLKNFIINKAALGVSPNAILLQMNIACFNFVPSKPSSEKFKSLILYTGEKENHK
jgi:hypothetical protein